MHQTRQKILLHNVSEWLWFCSLKSIQNHTGLRNVYSYMVTTLFLPQKSSKKIITIQLLPAGTLVASLVHFPYSIWQEVIRL